LVASAGGLAIAARHSHPKDTRPAVYLRPNGKIPVHDLPTVPKARNATRLDGQTASELRPSCPPATVDLGTWCLDESPYPLTNADLGKNDYFWASQACVAEGGYLPTAAQLIGAARRVKLESTLTDSPVTSTIDRNASLGLHDQREMSATLVTVTAGSDAAGSEGVSPGATGNPNTGQPNPVPEPANPEPETLQYVTVYSNYQHGGFAGSEPVSQPENFRCAFNKVPRAANQSTG
jgi:hypothetical protein